MDAVSMPNYLNMLEDTLKEHYLLHSLAQIYNIVESGISLDPEALNVVAKTGTKRMRYRSTGRKGQIIIVACASCAGQVLPPTIKLDSNGIPGQTWNCQVLHMATATKAG